MAKAANMTEETDKEEKDAEDPGASSRKRGGMLKRAKGGRIGGMKAKAHPGKRARGGGTSDMHPTTAAGNMSEPAYQRAQPGPDEGGKGADNVGKNG